MIFDTQMRLMATSAWLALDIEEHGRDGSGEVESEWMVPLLVEEERQIEGLATGVSL